MERVMLTGFVGLHPYTAHTSKDVNISVFYLGLHEGQRLTFRPVALGGDLADRVEAGSVPGMSVMVSGDWKKCTLDHLLYPLSCEVFVSSNQLRFPLDFAA